MAVVTGNVQSFGLQPLFSKQLRLKFTASGPASSVGRLLITDPIWVTPDAAGDFTVTLAATENLMPLRWYEVSAHWLNGAGVPVGYEFVNFKLFVPAAGGVLADLLDVTANPYMIWIGPEPPTNPALYVGWIDTDDAKYYEWEE